MACSGNAPIVTFASAISFATAIRRDTFDFTAPTVGLTLATASLASRISKSAYQSGRPAQRARCQDVHPSSFSERRLAKDLARPRELPPLQPEVLYRVKLDVRHRVGH